MLEKTYQPAEVEDRIYRTWVDAGAFDSGRPERKNAEPFCIVIPPPNVTGSLHMGHALNTTLQDILCRFERMRGKDVLWQPGTDHAGIATQMVVERQLMEKQEHRRALGREKFLERVWQWKAESGGIIIRQLKRLGASCDWRRERFTMDEGLSRAVIEVFVALHKEGLIYRDKRLVNWDPKLLTAISDLEVQQVEVKGHLWHIKYPVEGLANTYITVATTRPETMLGDTAVAVHPDDERYKQLVGKNAILPLVGRKIPIVADEYSDPEKGSGAVKITPAHDFNDFEVGRRHKLPLINIFSEDARVALKGNDAFLAGAAKGAELDAVLALDSKDRFVARKAIVEMLEEKELIEKIEPNVHSVPHGDRSGVVLEPRLTDQWYVDAKKLAVDAIKVVKSGKTSFVPKNWEKTYFDWLENIQPWCVSRQLWWGHQIPAWYAPDGKIFVERGEAEAKAVAKKHFGKDVALARDEDVLDTWFSSALWPFSTLGWPDKKPELKRYYPTSVLVTGFDIIFFWVARMMMMGLHFMKEIPFHTVYIHALVRDERGAKMSKSKGNIVDPLHLIDDYGADALRFTLTRMAAQGRDIKLSESAVAAGRNFVTKLWNAVRFAEMNEAVAPPNFEPSTAKLVVNQWILTKLADVLGRVEFALDEYRFNDAANETYHFVWSLYCDWYLELAKPILLSLDDDAKRETRGTIAYVRDLILKLLHPFMPFVTEELWRVTNDKRREPLLALAEWPARQAYFGEALEEVNWLIELVTIIRSVRSELNVPPSALVQLYLTNPSKQTLERLERWDGALNRLARIGSTVTDNKIPQGSVQVIIDGEVAAMPLKGVVDLAAERARLEKELKKVADDIDRVDKKLGNADFMARAPEEVVDEQREKRAEAEDRRAKISEALEHLKGAA
jgi:valyl-tRNA synthetase